MKLEQLLDDWCKLNREQLVRFIHDKHGAFAQVGNLLACQIEDSAGSANDHVHGVLETDNIIAQPGSARGDHDVDAEVLPKGFADLGCLHGELSGGDQDEALDLGDLCVDPFEGGNDKGGRLARAVLGARKNVTAGEGNGYAFFLDG